ncbi:MAG TPA: SelB C-terminal domain-containing protein, partial [Pyrinomonadaceae bacterium]|nr:SelB C-terminal domain-containing protein [Pyrinomonadaceae bacterium]
ADEGVMPQTREHFEICRLLGLKNGVIAMTKSDLADPETLELARLDIAELIADSFLADAPIIPVSSKTGDGIDELKEVLVLAANETRARTDRYVTFLPVDRSFSVKGFGTVVTGTLNSGQIAEGDELVLLPEEKRVRVRGVQSHGQSAESVTAGRRTAVNLAGVDHDEVSRGMVLTRRDVLQPTSLVNCEIEVLKSAPRSLKTRQRVRVHVGTAEVLGRVSVIDGSGEVAAGETGLVQLRLESPIAAIPSERLILRSYSPQATIGGGTILDVLPQKHRRRDIGETVEFLRDVSTALSDDRQWIELLVTRSGMHGMTLQNLRERTGLIDRRLTTALQAAIEEGTLREGGGCYVGAETFAAIESRLLAALDKFHKVQPLAPAMTRELLLDNIRSVPVELPAAVLVNLAIAEKIVQEAEGFRLASHASELTGDDAVVSDRIRKIYADAGLEVPKIDEALSTATAGMKMQPERVRKLLHLLLAKGEIVKATDEFYFSRCAIDETAAKIREYAATTTDRLIDVAKFKELTGVSRKYAIPLLEYFDGIRVTRRAGDKRVVI